MEITQTVIKGSMMNTIEKFHIHKAIKEDIHLNDTYTWKNPDFRHLMQLSTGSQIIPPPLPT
jgi:hypothetical protein